MRTLDRNSTIHGEMAEDRSHPCPDPHAQDALLPQTVSLGDVPAQVTVADAASGPNLSSQDTVALASQPGTRPSVESLAPLSSMSSLSIGAVIGEGGMGVVRAAVQRSLDRTVAIKTTLPAATGRDAERMLQEAWVTGFLEHPGVVPVHDILRGEDGAPVVVMRRIRGATWEALRSDEAWAKKEGARDLLEQNLRIFVRVCEVVEFAHAKGVLHRDIKPANVMLGSFGEVYLLDWGLALALSEDTAQHLPRAGMSKDLAGTLAYAAPEMIGAIDAPLSETTDVYLLGAVLYEMAVGRAPHDKSTVTLTLESIAASPPAIPPLVPSRLGAICRRALAKDPAARHEGVGPLRRDVLAFLRLRDSEHVVIQAQNALGALRAACAEDGARRRIYDLYGECRFAFREALHMWPESEEAKSGLIAAATLVIEHELARDPRVALALLEEAPELSSDLADRVRVAVASDAKERDKLTKLARVHERHTGKRARQVYFALLGIGWTASQFADPIGPFTHRRYLIGTLLQLPLVGIGYFVARDVMNTLFNRRLVGAVALMLVAQAGYFFCAEALGFNLLATRAMQIGLWAVIAACITTFLEKRAWPTVVGLIIGLPIVVRWPHLRALTGAACSLIVTINVALIWRARSAAETSD